MGKKKAKAEEKLEVSEAKTSVKTYQRGIEAETQKMNEYSGKFANAVKSLQKEFGSHKKELQNAAFEMREEGVKKMSGKVNKFKAEIKAQMKENKEATMHLLNEIDSERRDFQSYIHGAFQQYINAFWGR